MKHLKLFESFKEEDITNNNADIIADIKDILLPISDLGYSVNIEGYFNKTSKEEYKLEITIRREKFSLKEIIDDTSRLIDYMKNYQSIYRASPSTYVSVLQRGSWMGSYQYIPVGFSILSNSKDKQLLDKIIDGIKIFYVPKTPNNDIFTKEDEIKINL